MNLDELAVKYSADKASRWHGYTKYYEHYFSGLRNEPLKFLEIGVLFGASMQMWSDYFQNADIHGVDCYNNYQTTDKRVHIHLGNQGDRAFWNKFIKDNGSDWDVIIDDGGHINREIITSFDCLFKHVKRGGLYIIEDVFATYDEQFRIQGYPTMQLWTGELFSKVNHGGKDYCGKPHPLEKVELDELEKSIEFIHLYYGLIIIGKK